MRHILQKLPKREGAFVLSADNYDQVLARAAFELMTNSSAKPNMQICINFLSQTPPSKFNEKEARDRLNKLADAMKASSDSEEDRWKRSLAAATISLARVAREWLE